MSVQVTTLDPSERDTWESSVSRSSVGTVFHRYDFLEVAERHSSATFHPLIGYKGEEPVGVFPVFELRKGGLSTAFSPPPELGIPFLGPVFFETGSPKQRKSERRKRTFIEGCFEWVDEHISPQYYRFCTPVGEVDSRPFTWNDYDVSPLHTYHLDLDRPVDDLKSSFSKSLRRYLDPDDDRVTIDRGGKDAIQFVHTHVKSRYDAQNETYTVPLEFLYDLYDTLPSEFVRPYISKLDGEQTSGLFVLGDASTIYYSEGGGKPDVSYPINDLLHWRVIRDAQADGFTTYDLFGANTPRLCDYKAKFNPELKTYYEAEKSTRIGGIASDVYKRIR